MTLKRTLLLTLLLSVIGRGFAQLQKPDLAERAQNNPDSVLTYLGNRKGVVSNSEEKARRYFLTGTAYLRKGELDSTIFYWTNAKEIFIKNKNAAGIIQINISLADIYLKQSQLYRATELLLEADSINRESPVPSLQPDLIMSLGSIYKKSADYEKSLLYHQQAVEEFRKRGDTSNYIKSVFALSIMYRVLNMADSSLALLRREEALIKHHRSNMHQIAMFEEHIGESYFMLKKYKEALPYFNRSYARLKELGTGQELAYQAYCVGKTNTELEKFDAAEKYLLEAFRMNDSLKIINFQYDIAGTLSSLYEKKGDWAKALTYLRISTNLKTELDYQTQIRQINELREKYESEKQGNEILLLKTQNQLSETNTHRIKLIQYIFIILFIAAVIISWLLINRGRYKRKLEKQALRNRIAADLHDDIGSALTSIDILSRIAIDKNDGPSLVNDYLIKIRRQAQKTMDSMSDIVWSVNPANDSFESLLARMREFGAEICDANQKHLNFIEPAKKDIAIADAGKRKNIFLIFKETMNNACKHSGANHLNVEFEQTAKGFLVMTIQDDGTGFDQNEMKRGNGLRNMQERAQQIGGQLFIESIKERGTLVKLKCPL